MANLMDMALDDVIRQESTAKKSNGNNNNNRRRNTRNQNKDGGNVRRRDRGNNRQTPYARSARQGNSDETWTHDLYEGKGATRAQPDARTEISGKKDGGQQQQQFTVSFRGAASSNGTNGQDATSNATGSRVTVKNLHYDVSKDDLNELFGKVGSVKKVFMHYDKAGRSTGVADIIFADGDSARRSIERYDRVTLDGKLVINSICTK
ncbi:hypothetical protein BDF19DRAFT_437285 [Syncephalis fuscata]|nr:hypothetical protein BDF19DRAFT_437285 [Syncephalis fuscata]